MPVPNPNFRPNPSRAVYVQGAIDQGLLDRLTPQILGLQKESREAITVYIDSLGGSTFIAEQLRLLLLAPDQDSSSSCRLITVVTSRAASAAADLLSFGDYAIAYPNSYIHYHGVRRAMTDPLTAEDASRLNESLKLSNDTYAITLARRSFERFVFRYLLLKSGFDDYRKNDSEARTPLDCFVGLLAGGLSERARDVVKQAQNRNRRYEHLIDTVVSTVLKKEEGIREKRRASVEASLLKELIDLKLAANTNEDWTFQHFGLAQLSDDFLLLSKYITHQHDEHIDVILNRWGDFCLSEDIKETLTKTPPEMIDKEKSAEIKLILVPLWVFFVAFCHVLQGGEYELTATDAYRLGLVDEVLGSQLPCPRMLVEFLQDLKRPAQGESASE